MIKSSSHNRSYHFDLRSVSGDRLLLGFCMEFLCSCASLSSLLRFICIDRQILRFAAVPQWFPWKSDITWPIFSLMCKQNNQRHSQSPRYDREARAHPTPSAYTTISTCLWSAISLRALLSEVQDLQRDLSHTHRHTYSAYTECRRWSREWYAHSSSPNPNLNPSRRRCFANPSARLTPCTDTGRERDGAGLAVSAAVVALC